jgi:hypothetical protein
LGKVDVKRVLQEEPEDEKILWINPIPSEQRTTEPPTFHQSNADEACSYDQRGTWRFVKESDGIHSKWCPSNCRYADFSNSEAKEALKGTKIYFAGNSHIRNLFRCASDVISDTTSWSRICTNETTGLPATTCNSTLDTKLVSKQKQGKGKGKSKDKLDWTRHIASCTNRVSVHGFDYDYIDTTTNIAFHSRWAPFWQDTPKRRMACSRDTFLKPSAVQCLTKSQFHYYGARVGFDFLRGEFIRLFKSEDDVYLVMNYYSQTHLDWFLHIAAAIQHPRLKVSLKDRTIFVVDPLQFGAVANHLIEQLVQAGVHVLDLRFIWQKYDSGKHPMDVEGGGVVHNHLNAPLQRVLVHQVLSAVLSKRDPPTWRSLPTTCQ